MTKIMSNIHYFVLTLFFTKHSLKGHTWKRIKSDSPDIYRYKKEQQWLKSYNFITSPHTAFCLSLAILCLFGLMCFISVDFSGTVLERLNFLVFSKKQAEHQLSLSLTISASLIAISFVVIGFLIEVVKERSQSTFFELFRATKLYLVLSFAFAAILFLIILNGIKYSIDSHTIGNLAILSIYVLMTIVLSIAFLFLQILKFFTPQSLIELSNKIVLNSAKRQIVTEELVYKSKEVYKELCESFKLKESQPLIDWDDPVTYNPLSLKNKEGYLNDVNLYFLKKVLKNVNCSPNADICGKFDLMHHEKFLSKNHPLFFFSESNKAITLSSFTFRNAFFFIEELDVDDFLKEKETLINRFKLASERGDIEVLERQFKIVEELYEIYYSINRN